MISYHPNSDKLPIGTTFTAGFRPFYNDDVTEIAAVVAVHAWSPVVFTNGYRNKLNFNFADWIGLDFDAAEDMSLADAVRTFCDAVHIIGTTRNHLKNKDGLVGDRFRVLLKLSERATNRLDFEYTLRSIAKKYPIDASCCDAARHYFACAEIISIQDTGYAEDLLRAPAPDAVAVERHRASLKARRDSRALPPWVQSWLRYGVPEGGGGRAGRHMHVYKIGAQLHHAGFSSQEIVAFVLASPLSVIGESEVVRHVNNGFRAAQLEVDNGGSGGHGRGQEQKKTENPEGGNL